MSRVLAGTVRICCLAAAWALAAVITTDIVTRDLAANAATASPMPTAAASPPEPAKSPAPAPYVGASEADNEFYRITAADMEIIRSKRVLFGSRSSGMCLHEGLASLAAKNRIYTMPLSPIYSPAYGSQPKEIPDEVKSFALIHYLFTNGSTEVRAKEFEDLFNRFLPQLNAATLDVQVLGGGESTDPMTQTFDRLRKKHPNVQVIYSTTRLQPDPSSSLNEISWKLGQAIVQKYRGQAPVFDWLSLLATHADGTITGHYTCMEFNTNNDKMHPNAPFIKARLGRAYLVMMYKLFCSPGLAANAGFDRTVAADGGAVAAKALLDGSASVDNKAPSRKLARYVWREGDQVLAEGDQPTAEVSLPLGVHAITLTVTNGGTSPQSSSDEVRITVAEAKADITNPTGR